MRIDSKQYILMFKPHTSTLNLAADNENIAKRAQYLGQ